MNDPLQAHGNPLRSISAIVPVDDAGARLVTLLDSLADQLHDLVPDFEIVLIDDGSSEGTTYLSAELAQRMPSVRMVRHVRRQGLGACWREGIALASKQYTLFVDLDRMGGIENLARMARWGDRYDVAAAYRQVRRESPLARMRGLLARRFLRWVLGLRARDLNGGVLMVRTSLLKGIVLTSKGAVVRAELRLRLQQRTPSLVEIPVPAPGKRSGRTRWRLVEAVVNAAVDLIRLQRRLRRERGATPPPSDGSQNTRLSA